MYNSATKGYSFSNSKIFGGLEGNPRKCLTLSPLWSIFANIVLFYTPLYMEALNVTKVQMGFLNSFAAALGVFTAFIAGPIIDRFGRRKSLFYSDLIAWTTTMLIWAVSKNYWFFLAAAITNSFAKIAGTASTCLATEDIDEDKKTIYFSLGTIAYSGCGIFILAAGIGVKILGLINAMRLICVLGCISMTTMFVWRFMIVPETGIGSRIMLHDEKVSLKDKWKQYIHAIKFMVGEKKVLTMFMIMLLNSFQMAFQFFNILYLKDTLGFSPVLVSITPAVAAGISLFVHFIFLPRLMNRNRCKNIILGLFLAIIGNISLIITPPKGYMMLIISTAFSASGGLIISAFLNAIWNTIIGNEERAEVFSACQSAVSIVSIPSGIIAGLLYKSNSTYPILTTCAIQLITIFFAWIASKYSSHFHAVH